MPPAIAATQDFQFIAGSLALDFVNTVGNRLSVSREYLGLPRDFKRWVQLAGIPLKIAKGTISASELSTLHSKREMLYRTFRRPVLSTRAMPRGWLQPLNQEIARVASERQLTYTKGRIEWDWVGPAPGAGRIWGLIVWDAAELLITESFRLISQCQDEACGWLFLDHSPQRNRRWCSMIDCGNRAKARRFYRDHRAPSG